MDSFLSDLRHALRSLSRSPTLVAFTVAILAIGLGLNATVFGLVNGLLLRPLPYRDPGRIVRIHEVDRRVGRAEAGSSYATFVELRQAARTFSEMAAYREVGFNLSSGGAATVDAERVGGAEVSGGVFRVLGVQPALGRTFVPDEDRAGGEPVVVISHSLWQRYFGADTTIVGRSVTLDGVRATVIGLMPPGFHFQEYADVWVPLAPRALSVRRDDRSVGVIGRLRPGARVEHVRGEVEAFAHGLAQRFPESHAGWTMGVRELGSGRDDGVGPAALLLLVAVVFVLLIACANVGNLMLARAAARRKEIVIRSVLGAEPRRIVRQLLTEGAVLALAGGAAGCLLALWGTGIVVASLFPVEYMPAWLDFTFDWRVLAYITVASFATVLVFSLLPALPASRPDLATALRDSSRGSSAARGGSRLRGALVIAQLALSLILLTGAGLMIRSFRTLRALDYGFDATGVLTMRVMPPPLTYRGDADVIRYAAGVLDALKRVPGATSSALVGGAVLPGGGLLATDLRIAGQQASRPEELQQRVTYQAIDGDYFGALRIALRRGRQFTAEDRAGSPPVALVNEAMAARFWPGEDPIGKQLRMNDRDPRSPWLTVVGVVGDVRTESINAAGITANARAQFYIPFAQQPTREINLIVRAAGRATGLSPTAQRAVLDVDPDVPAYQVMPMERATGVFARFIRSFALLLAAFGAFALLLSAVGVYGVVSYAVGQRRQEIGIRMAIGAQSRDVLALVMRQGMRPVLVGVVLGVAGSLALTRALRMLLYGVTSSDFLTFGAVVTLLTGVAALANYLPAVRATRLDPLVALRE